MEIGYLFRSFLLDMPSSFLCNRLLKSISSFLAEFYKCLFFFLKKIVFLFEIYNFCIVIARHVLYACKQQFQWIYIQFHSFSPFFSTHNYPVLKCVFFFIFDFSFLIVTFTMSYSGSGCCCCFFHFYRIYINGYSSLRVQLFPVSFFSCYVIPTKKIATFYTKYDFFLTFALRTYTNTFKDRRKHCIEILNSNRKFTRKIYIVQSIEKSLKQNSTYQNNYKSKATTGIKSKTSNEKEK